jgi:NTP pyrophosphatase (non-canonical NTP hydrolase)
MTIDEIQKQVDTWIKNTGSGYHSVLTNTAILMEEVGELASVLARTDGDQIAKESDKLDYEDELADIFWVLIAIANQKDVNLTEALHRNYVKKNKRDANRFK